jgi:uncharacterized protein (TIGR02246 family)
MIRRLQCLLLGLVVASPLVADDAADASRAAIREAARAYVDAFNAHDAAAVGPLWAENAVYADRVTGARTEGRAAIEAKLVELFAESPGIRLQFEAGDVRFITPDVARAETTATVNVPDSDPSRVAVTAVYVKSGEAWLLDSVEEMNLPEPESSAAALADLEWLVGDWSDAAEGRVSTSSFRWGAEGAFLVRSFAVSTAEAVESEGTQVIGWDPRALQIRSWTFNSDGSFGEATWSRNGEDWLVKSSQTLADGGAASGTYVITPVDANTMTVQLIGHEVDGEPQPASDPVTVTRLAEVPAEAPAAASEGGSR